MAKLHAVVALSVEQAAAAIGISPRALRRAIFETGELVAFRGPNNAVRIRVEDLSAYVARWPRATIRRYMKRRSVPNERE